jgi:hypothetical protein
MKKIVSGIMLTLLLVGMLTLAFDIQQVKSEQSTQLLLMTNKDIYSVGENVTITILNVGSETVSIGGYPAWQIFTYPGKEPVYPKYFIFLSWSLEPGENNTITWNQYNAFTESFVEPGKYIVEDNQGWGLSTYFTIASLKPVGGYSIPIQVHTKTEPVLPYIALIATLTAIFTKLRPKTKRKR